jgi:hypothetical protein
MRRGQLALVLLLSLSLGLFLAAAAEDLPDTAFDESETIVYIGAHAFLIEVHARTTEAALRSGSVDHILSPLQSAGSRRYAHPGGESRNQPFLSRTLFKVHYRVWSFDR